MIRPFELHRPESLQAASSLLRDLPDAAVICGGTELLQVMKMGLARFEHLVDVKAIPELKGIRRVEDGRIWIGAATTHREVERSTLIADTYPRLAELARRLANVRVRNVGTIGGNLCFAEPHSDPAAFLLAADAVLVLESAEGRRELSVSEFVIGALTTALDPDELLVGVRLPAPEAATRFSYERIAHLERPAASICCRITTADGVVTDARLVVGAVGDIPALADVARGFLIGSAVARLDQAADAAADAVASSADAVDDVNGTAEYKRHLTRILTRRAVLRLVEAAAA